MPTKTPPSWHGGFLVSMVFSWKGVLSSRALSRMPSERTSSGSKRRCCGGRTFHSDAGRPAPEEASTIAGWAELTHVIALDSGGTVITNLDWSSLIDPMWQESLLNHVSIGGEDSVASRESEHIFDEIISAFGVELEEKKKALDAKLAAKHEERDAIKGRKVQVPGRSGSIVTQYTINEE